MVTQISRINSLIPILYQILHTTQKSATKIFMHYIQYMNCLSSEYRKVSSYGISKTELTELSGAIDWYVLCNIEKQYVEF